MEKVFFSFLASSLNSSPSPCAEWAVRAFLEPRGGAFFVGPLRERLSSAHSTWHVFSFWIWNDDTYSLHLASTIQHLIIIVEARSSFFNKWRIKNNFTVGRTLQHSSTHIFITWLFIALKPVISLFTHVATSLAASILYFSIVLYLNSNNFQIYVWNSAFWQKLSRDQST